jgi:hypothetical protein
MVQRRTYQWPVRAATFRAQLEPSSLESMASSWRIQENGPSVSENGGDNLETSVHRLQQTGGLDHISKPSFIAQYSLLVDDSSP